MTEDDKLKQLFDNYDPQLRSNFQFMARLKDSLDAVEIVKQRNEAQLRASRRAICVAASVAFALGVMMALIYPSISNLMQAVDLHFNVSQLHQFHIDGELMTLILMAGVTGIITLNSYKIALSRLDSKV